MKTFEIRVIQEHTGYYEGTIEIKASNAKEITDWTEENVEFI